MSVDRSLAKSRVLGVAKSLLSTPIDEKLVYSKNVVLTGEAEVLSTQNGKWCFLDSLRILSRMVGNLKVVVPYSNSALFTDVSAFIQDAWSNGRIELIDGDCNDIPLECDAVLSVGTLQNSSLPWTVINSNGWLARISSDSNVSLPSDVNQANPISALMAASLGAAEVFKRIFDVPNEVAPLMSRTEFSLFELSENHAGLGPAIPIVVSLPDTLLIGAGAIGNGTALLMSQLPLKGQVHIIDKQDYADENLGTCVLINKSWLGKSKAEELGLWLKQNSNLTVTSNKAPIETIKSDLVSSELNFDLVLNGLDNAVARRVAQDIWPKVIIDGGITEIGAAVIQYRLSNETHACLKCWFDLPVTDEREQQSIWTGLSVNSLANLARPLTDEDIALAIPEKKDWLELQKNEGKTICSIISEAALANKLGVDAADGFRPSVPFVATIASALVVAEAVKSVVSPDVLAKQKFQIGNLFLGTMETAIELSMVPLSSCQCVIHRNLIKKISEDRSKKQNPNNLKVNTK